MAILLDLQGPFAKENILISAARRGFCAYGAEGWDRIYKPRVVVMFLEIFETSSILAISSLVPPTPDIVTVSGQRASERS